MAGMSIGRRLSTLWGPSSFRVADCRAQQRQSQNGATMGMRGPTLSPPFDREGNETTHQPVPQRASGHLILENPYAPDNTACDKTRKTNAALSHHAPAHREKRRRGGRMAHGACKSRLKRHLLQTQGRRCALRSQLLLLRARARGVCARSCAPSAF